MKGLSMFAGIKNGTGLIKECVKAFGKYPSLIIPLLVCWAIYAPVLVHFKFFFPWDNYSTGQQLAVVFFVILLFSFILSVSCLILLELIEQIETGKRLNIFSATLSSIPNIIESIGNLKNDILNTKKLSLDLEETLIALSISATTNPTAKLAMDKLKDLHGCEMHITHIPTPGDETGLRKLGVNLTSDPNFSSNCLLVA